jgi:pimeloyl-ACP methyl ester carboxylesterase
VGTTREFCLGNLEQAKRFGQAVELKGPQGTQINESVEWATTSDGHQIALQRYSPASETGRLPVLLVHGLGTNRHNFDLFGDEEALPRQLARRGHEAFVVEVRGVGLSRAERGHGREHGIEQYLRYDMPATVDHILRTSGAPKLHWVGHSMGAMLGYIYGASFGDHLQSLLAAAGPLPAAVPLPGKKLIRKLRHVIAGKRLQQLELPNRLGVMAMKAVPPALVRFAYDKLIFCSENMPDEFLEKFASSGLENIPLSVLRRLGDWASPGSAFGGEMERALGGLYVNTLFLAATYDPLCPPDVIEHARRMMPEGFARTRVISREHGFEHDFGHADLLASPAAKKCVFPLVLDFIEQQEAQRVRALASHD